MCGSDTHCWSVGFAGCSLSSEMWCGWAYQELRGEYPHPRPKPPHSLTDKTNAGEWRERPEMRNEKETYLRYQISHFHNSTFLNKLSRLSHQTSLPPRSPPCFIYVLIPHCRGPLLRECPIVSREKHWSWGREVSLGPPLWAGAAPQRQKLQLH